VKIIGEAQQSQTKAGVRFETYLSRALQAQADTGLTAQVLGYLHESERRSTVMLTYSRLFRRLAVLLLFFTVLGAVAARLTVGVLGTLVAGIFSGLGIIDLLLMGVLGAAIFFYAIDSYTWTNTALKTLETLIGPTEEGETGLADSDRRVPRDRKLTNSNRCEKTRKWVSFRVYFWVLFSCQALSFQMRIERSRHDEHISR
jgi:hypothetical protein